LLLMNLSAYSSKPISLSHSATPSLGGKVMAIC
jgi:hypothetical protein